MGNFTLNVVLRVAIIILLAFALAFIVLFRQSFFLPIAIVIVMAIVVVNLVTYIRQTTRHLTKLLLSVKQNAFTDSIVRQKLHSDVAEFADIVQGVTDEFARVAMEKELHYQYLSTLNENIGIAILSFDENGKLLMANPAARKLLPVRRLNYVDDLISIDPTLPETMRRMRSSEKEVMRLTLNQELTHLAIQLKEIVLSQKPIKIFLFQNIQSELESKEVEAWQQLTRVLTHEIMNSVTPISSLTEAVKTILVNRDGSRIPISNLSNDNIEDIYTSVETISARSKGLLRFVHAYKDFSRVPRLHSRAFDVKLLIDRTVKLFEPDLQRMNIQCNLSVPDTPVNSNGDEALLGQVLINLVKNAMEAIGEKKGEIKISLQKEDKTIIEVSDNGGGITGADLENIFVPFFTTKSSGTGVGLSLSRQIMKLHRGTIKVLSKQGDTTFTIMW